MFTLSWPGDLFNVVLVIMFWTLVVDTGLRNNSGAVLLLVSVIRTVILGCVWNLQIKIAGKSCAFSESLPPIPPFLSSCHSLCCWCILVCLVFGCAARGYG